MMLALLDSETTATYHRDGVAVLRGILDAEWLQKLASAIDDNMRSPGPYGKNHAEGGAAYFGDYVNWQRFPAFRDVGEKGPLGAVAAELMRSTTVRLFHEHVLVKEPGNTSPTPWHQDMPYYCLDGSQTVSLWIPLDQVKQQVCPHFLAGSHSGNATYMPRRFKTLQPLEGDTSTYLPFPEIDEERDADRLRSYDLEPGDMIAFNYYTLHNAPPNTASTRRRAVSMRYVGDDVRYVARPHEVSPPFPDMGLKLEMGDALPDSWFPKVWQSA
jgi:ectoine hydroxylase-related dioxygenase (phytanoyl-CoA dioxygenase family)